MITFAQANPSIFDKLNSTDTTELLSLSENYTERRNQPAKFVLQFFVKNKKQQWKEKYFFFYHDRILISKDEIPVKIKTIKLQTNMKLKFVIRPSHQAEAQSFKNPLSIFNFGIILSLNNQEVTAYSNELKTFKKAKRFLSQLCIQSTFHEDFKVLKKLGKGASSTVYLANEILSGKQYAVKQFSKKKLLKQEEGLKTIMNEIILLRQLKHKNIIKLKGVYESQNSIYIIQQYINDGTLQDYLENMKKRKFSKILDIIKQILLGVNHIHAQQIIHRDIKLENILLNKKKDVTKVIISDFGLATKFNIDVNEITLKKCGTPGFVAPEVLQYNQDKEFYNEKCDIFSIGMIFYMLLFKENPFYSEDIYQFVMNNKNCNIQFDKPKQMKKIPAEYIILLKQMVCKNPQERITINECLKNIEEICNPKDDSLEDNQPSIKINLDIENMEEISTQNWINQLANCKQHIDLDNIRMISQFNQLEPDLLQTPLYNPNQKISGFSNQMSYFDKVFTINSPKTTRHSESASPNFEPSRADFHSSKLPKKSPFAAMYKKKNTHSNEDLQTNASQQEN